MIVGSNPIKLAIMLSDLGNREFPFFLIKSKRIYTNDSIDFPNLVLIYK